ncbi:MAG: diaminopimelate decarboxylase [Deltaproteobacteria bacterium]|nr:diaminopimelate decarboxylase [Candidatus Zymogenaceae bacterium]
MNYFNRENGELSVEEIPVVDLVREHGTPLYIYSARTLRHHYRVFKDALGGMDHLICFAMKANSNLSVLKLFFDLGAGADIVSGGELFRALQAGVDPSKVVYSGVGKTEDEITAALEADILMFNVESFQELTVINGIAQEMGATARISVRVNPDVDPKTHPKISTGLKANKFGLDITGVIDDYERARERKNIQVVGVDCHIGSQLTEIGPFEDALKRLVELIERLRERNFEIQYLDFGGGLGITYQSEEPPDPTEYARAIEEIAGDLGVTFILEPGRVLVGNAGILVTRVLYTKETEKHFVIVDAGMNDLARPAIYDSYHRIVPVVENGADVITADIVGPICESSDYLAKDRDIPRVVRDDLLAVESAGAYSFSMASNYNSRPRCAEIMVDGKEARVVRKRETYEDLIRGEEI